MNVKTATFSGSADWIADPTDVKWMLPRLQQHVFHKTVNGYNHGDFIWATNTPTELFADILKLINKYG